MEETQLYFLITCVKCSIKFRCWAQFDYQSVLKRYMPHMSIYLLWTKCRENIFRGLIRPSPVQAWEIYGGSGSGERCSNNKHSGLRDWIRNCSELGSICFIFTVDITVLRYGYAALQHGNSERNGLPTTKRFAVKHLLEKQLSHAFQEASPMGGR